MSTAIPLSCQDEPRMIIPFRSQGQVFGESYIAEQPAEPLTLLQFYDQELLPSRARQKSAVTLKADREALNAWATFTDNCDLRALDWSSPRESRETLKYLRGQLQKYVLGQLATGDIAATTINKRLRHLRHFLRVAADPIDHALIGHVPDLGKVFTGTNSAWQIKADRLPPRETVTRDEMERLFPATAAALDPHLWKVIILVLWSYGVRTEDHFFRLDWSLIDVGKMLMRFTANKTSKLQGVPLTPLLLRALQSLGRTSGPIFGNIHRGTWCKSTGWKAGYYTTWSRDILPSGRFAVCKGPAEHQAACAAVADVRPNLMFHHFRKTMVTELNIYSGQAGNWVAAHYMGGVSEQFYDTPTERIETAVRQREEERLPDCWRHYFSAEGLASTAYSGGPTHEGPRLANQ